MFHTPRKTVDAPEPSPPRTPNKTFSLACSSGMEQTPSKPNVRRSIGEWEAGKADSRVKSKTPPTKTISPATAGPKQNDIPTQGGKPVVRRPSVGDMGVSPPKTKYVSRVSEAKAMLTKAKLHLGNSRNLKSDIKTGVIQALDRLYQLVLEAEKGTARKPRVQMRDCEQQTGDDLQPNITSQNTLEAAQMGDLIAGMREQNQLIAECKQQTQALADQIKSLPALDQPRPTYARVTSSSKREVIHSIVVASGDEADTSGEVLDKIRSTVDAGKTGVRVDRIKKVRDRKVVVGCCSKEELDRVADRIRSSGANLQVESLQNKDPLIILRDVMSYNTDEDIVAALRKQNGHIIGDIPVDEQRIQIKYRRRTRNPHASHVVAQVSPRVWQRLTEAERVHIDIQRVWVEDQSPLVQCSLCLGYGHGRRYCKENAEKCSHCGGPHMWSDCALRLADAEPTCCNCTLAKLANISHNAFSQSCPVRRKWDAIARASVSYC